VICPFCRRGGDYLKHAESKAADAYRDYFRRTAETCHAKCKGGTHCDCQHWTDASGIQEKFQNSLLSTGENINEN